MNKEQFLAGVSFRIKANSNTTFKVEKTSTYGTSYYIVEEFRMSDGSVFNQQHHANIEEITETGFKAYSFVLEQKAESEHWFANLIPVEENTANSN